MKVLILAGGKGTRLSEETGARPKPMVEIGGRPIIWHLMKLLEVGGITEFVVCAGYRGEVIKDYFLNYEGRSNDFFGFSFISAGPFPSGSFEWTAGNAPFSAP